jgi:hypothetical protein
MERRVAAILAVESVGHPLPVAEDPGVQRQFHVIHTA